MTRDSKRNQRQPSRTEPWEVEYVHQELPTHPVDDIEKATDECKQEVEPSTDREKVLKCVRRKFS